MDAGQPSLQNRRLKLSLQYYMKLEADPDNPAYSCVVNPVFQRLFRSKRSAMPTLGIRLQSHLKDMEMELDAISVVRPPQCPPPLLQHPNNFFKPLRSQEVASFFLSMLLELFCRYTQQQKVHRPTDGSKGDNRTGMSFVCDDDAFSCRNYQQ